jgi:hypothetical protein
LAEVPEEHGRLSIAFATGVEVDVARVLSGDVTLDEAKRLPSGDLLAGLTFDDEPGFDSWLLLQRSRVGAAVGEVLTWAASTLAHTEPDAALEIIGRATRADPFNDWLHELAVEIHLARGDRRAAEAWVQHVNALYARELGEPAPATIRRPLDRPRPAADAPLIRLDTAARALLEGAQARFDAGDYQGGLEMARRLQRGRVRRRRPRVPLPGHARRHPGPLAAWPRPGGARPVATGPAAGHDRAPSRAGRRCRTRARLRGLPGGTLWGRRGGAATVARLRPAGR